MYIYVARDSYVEGGSQKAATINCLSPSIGFSKISATGTKIGTLRMVNITITTNHYHHHRQRRCTYRPRP